MRKILGLIAAALILSGPVYASVGVKANGTPHGAAENLNFTCQTGSDCSTQTGVTRTIPLLQSTLYATGVATGGATSVASTTTAVPVGYTYVRKVITSNSDAAFTAGTMANGVPGQILTIAVAGLSPSGATTGGNYTITPTLTTGFTSIKLTAVNDYARFQFVDTTIGWVLIGYGGTVTIVLKP